MLNSEETLTQKLVQKWSWIFLFTILTAPLGYVIKIILTNDISPGEIGILYGIISLLMLLSVYNDFWLTESLNYFLPKYIIENDYGRCKYLLLFAFSVQLITSVILGFGLFYFADFLAVWHFKDPIAWDVLRIMSLFFLWINMIQVSSIIFWASQNTKFQKWTEFFRMFITMIGVIWLFALDQWDILTYAWAWIGALYIWVILNTILGYIYYYRPYFQWVKITSDNTLRKKFIQYSIWTFVWANIGTLLHNLDQQILLNLTSSVEWGVYSIYLSLIGIPFIFLTPILAFLFPVISEIYSRWQLEKIRSIHGIFSNTMSIIMLWASALFIILWTNIALFLFGPEYEWSWKALIYIAPFLVLNILIQINFQIMAGTWMIRQRVWILAKTLIINILLIVWLIIFFEQGKLPFPNAASATSFWVWLSWIIMWILSYRAIHTYSWSFDWHWFNKNLIAIWTLSVTYFYFNIDKIIPTFWLQWRLSYIPEIIFVFLWSMIIFMLLNKKYIKDFIMTVKSVRSNKA